MSQTPLHARHDSLRAGPPLGEARGAVVLVHGRGADAASILPLGKALELESVAFVAPQADDSSWYPQSFLAPIAANEPWLSAALARLGSEVDHLREAGFAPERIGLLGFSQGACLVSEYAFRQPRRYGAAIALTGGLIGPPGAEHAGSGSLEGTPVLLASGDPDPHVPWSRVEETAEAFTRLGARVDLRRYPGRPHTVSDDEIAQARSVIARFASLGG